MLPYDVYIVRCSDGSFYTGMTDDLERRIGEHNAGTGPNAYTFTRRPVKLVYVSDFGDVWQAMEWEKKIKRWSRAKKEALIRGEYEKLPELSRTAGNWLVYPWQQRTRKSIRVMLSLSKHDTNAHQMPVHPSTGSG
jgi:putative endonuclease